MTTPTRGSRKPTQRPASTLWRRVRREDDGIAAVEFAIILPVLVAMLMGIIDWGFFFFYTESIVNAAREGARAGVVDQDDPEGTAKGVAEDYLAAAGIPDEDAGRNATAVTASEDGTDLDVTITMTTFSGLTGFLAPPLIPTGITYTSTMRLEPDIDP